MNPKSDKFFYGAQRRWVKDNSPLRICEKGRQIGMSFADAYDSVRKAGEQHGRDVWVMSRDEIQAKQYVHYCKRWAQLLCRAASKFGEQMIILGGRRAVRAQFLAFKGGATIYALSSNPDAIVGKTGHVKLDEFALHRDQRELYAVAKPVTQWGGTLSIISTHRGPDTMFNQIITNIKTRGNRMGWSLHSIPIQKAVEEGLVEKINRSKGGSETREAWLERQHAECIDEESWLQEYCCVPADESRAFITYDMIVSCEDDSAWLPVERLKTAANPLYIGVDIARTSHLTVIDVEELIGDVLWERHRIEMQNQNFSVQEETLWNLLALPQSRRCCIDATGLGMQLAERTLQRFGEGRVEAIRFSAQLKEKLAYPLLTRHQDRTLRYRNDRLLRADLRGVHKETTIAGNVRFVGESGDSHCDRFWAKALAVHAAASNVGAFAYKKIELSGRNFRGLGRHRGVLM